MNEHERIRITRCFPQLVRDLRVKDVKDYLYRDEILTLEDLQNVSIECITPMDLNRRLIKILVTKKNSYSFFLNALNDNGFKHLAEALETCDITGPVSDIVDGPLESDFNLKQLQNQVVHQTEFINLLSHEKDSLEQKLTESSSSKEEMNFYKKYYLFVDNNNQNEIDIVITEAITTDIVNYFGLSKEIYSGKDYKKFIVLIREKVAELFKGEKITDNFLEAVAILRNEELEGLLTLKKVADNIFADEAINWGRIVSFLAFGAWIARMSKENGFEHIVVPIRDFMRMYINRELGNWIKQSGGWEDFYCRYSGDFNSKQVVEPWNLWETSKRIANYIVNNIHNYLT